MATMSIRSTYALDPATDSRIVRLSKLWNVSKAEVIRRSIATVDAGADKSQGNVALEALERLQGKASLTEQKVSSWESRRRTEWVDAWKKSDWNATSARKRSS